MLEISSQFVLENLIKSNKTVFVYIYASWCGACKFISPIIEQYSQLYPTISFVKVNCDVSQDIPHSFGVSSLPTFIVFQHGIEVSRQTGANRDQLDGLIRRYA